MEQPQGFFCKGTRRQSVSIEESPLVLKQAPRAWYSRIDDHLQGLGFKKILSE